MRCRDSDPFNLYSLQGDNLNLVIVCPPGFACNGSTFISLTCCNRTLRASFPPGATDAQRTAIIRDLVAQCAILQESCGGPKSTLYANRPIAYSSECSAPGQPSTGTYTFTLPAGTFLAESQALADAQARSYADFFGRGNQFCLSVPALCPCANELTNFAARIDGGQAPFTVDVASGSLPFGMAPFYSAANNHTVFIRGTPVTPGRYQFGLRVRDASGGQWQQTVVVSVLSIGYYSPLSATFTVPAVAATVSATFGSTDNLSVGSIVRFGKLNGAGITTSEVGSFEVMAIASLTVTLKNLSATAGVSVTSGSNGYWPLLTIPDFTPSVPYSFQLPGAGGSGSYAWKLVGDLPTGLTMTAGGLISGTPTGPATTFSVEMIDLDCQAVDRTFFRPAVRIVGHSVMTTATVRGYEEFNGFTSYPPKKYMVRTYRGLMSGNDAAGNPVLANEGVSIYLTANNYPESGQSVQLAYAMVQMSGYEEINLAGQTISTANILKSSSCPNSNVSPLSIYFGEPLPLAQTIVPGWCFPYDTSLSYEGRPTPTPTTCGACNYPLLPDSSITFGSIGTIPSPYLYAAHPVASSATYATNTNEGQATLGLFGSPPPIFLPFPTNLGAPFLGGTGAGAIMSYKHNYDIELTVEYTDAMALAQAEVFNSNGLVAESRPRTTGFVSTWTTVTFDLKLRNLVFGEQYEVNVDFVTDQNVTTTRTYNFLASGTTHTISDSAPVPPDQHTVTVRNPRVAFTT